MTDPIAIRFSQADAIFDACRAAHVTMSTETHSGESGVPALKRIQVLAVVVARSVVHVAMRSCIAFTTIHDVTILDTHLVAHMAIRGGVAFCRIHHIAVHDATVEMEVALS
jgi:hypothetical protein